MEKTYRIKPLQWKTTEETDNSYKTHRAKGCNNYSIMEFNDGFSELYVISGDNTEILNILNFKTSAEAINYCQMEYIETMKDNLIELT